MRLQGGQFRSLPGRGAQRTRRLAPPGALGGELRAAQSQARGHSLPSTAVGCGTCWL